MLSYYLEKGFLLSASTFGEDEPVTPTFPLSLPDTFPLFAYSYAILKVVQIAQSGETLICFRNPWKSARHLSNTKYHEKSPLWTSQLRAYVQPDLSGHGSSIFWLDQEEILTYFKSIAVCMLDNWHEVRMRGKFLRL